MVKKSIYQIRWIFVLLVLLFTLGIGNAKGQQRCHTTELQQLLDQKNPGRETKDYFETWLRKKGEEKKDLLSTFRTTATVVTLPVVVHVIHQGEEIGQGSNIPDEQILSQIEVLNEDFRRTNADASETLVDFQSVAADMEIQFVLAKQDPEGLPTTGIERVLADKSFYGINDGQALSDLSYWPAEDYINIWVTKMGSNLLGFAQFPVSDLEGLEDASTNRLTDGIVIHYQAFGSIDHGDFPDLIEPFIYGRTTTHELGHFFGLRHIWGDGNCTVDDFCDDTPTADDSHEGCNLSTSTCGQLNMVQNYMDYTDDVCMNLFTLDQKARMRTVLDNSPRRQSLISSPGAVDPIVYADDLGIKSIIAPKDGECNGSFTPVIEVRNYGSNDITSAMINLISNGVTIQTLDFNQTLTPLETTEIEFSIPDNLDLGQNSIEFSIVETNGGSDNNNINNTVEASYDIVETSNNSISEQFSDIPEDWKIENPDIQLSWNTHEVIGFDESDNSAIGILHFDYTNGVNQVDRLITPVKDLSQAISARFSFRYAYAYRSGRSDRLTVAISDDCGNSFDRILFDKSGQDLATSELTTSFFEPENRFDWVKESFDLDEFLGNGNIRIAFISESENGNNLYLDDVQMEIYNQQETDLVIQEVFAPNLFGCNTTISPVIRIKNQGKSDVNNSTAILNVAGQEKTVSIPSIAAGEVMAVNFESVELTEGEHGFTFTLAMPPGITDENPENNTITHYHVISQETIEVPFREGFESGTLDQTGWSLINPDQEITWELTNTNGAGSYSRVAYMNGYDYEQIGQEDALVSPIFDLRNWNEASLRFNYSYANAPNYEDEISLYISENCGNTFPHRLFSANGDGLGIISSEAPWEPNNEFSWNDGFVDLSEFAGKSNLRLAFVFTNQYGNNFYLDDIEFFLTNNPSFPIPEENRMVVYPNPVVGYQFNVTYNLEDKERIQLAVVDNFGRKVFNKTLSNTLNQTYTIELPDLPDGIYFVVSRGTSFNQVERLILHH